MPKSICEVVRQAETNYRSGSTHLGEYVDWSMRETVERIYAYLSSKHISGSKDALGRDKPFFNIISAAVNIWYRATDIDRKDIKFIPKKQSSVVLAFVANVLLQNWMDEARFGVFLNDWGLTMARYGGAIRKFVDKGDQLVPSVIPWQRYVPDTVQFDALPHIEFFYKTPAQLKNMATPNHPDYAHYNMNVVDSLLASVSQRKTVEGAQKDNLSEFIPIYEVHGVLDTRLLEDNPDTTLDASKITFRQQMHVVSFVAKEKGKDGKSGYDDFTLYKGKEKMDVYGMDALIKEEGRTLPIGAVEYLFDAQWMANHSMKAWKDNMDLASKLIFQTADKNFVNMNILSAVEHGQILIHSANNPLERVANQQYDLSDISNFMEQWKILSTELTSTPESMRGTTMPSHTSYRLAALETQQANSLFEIMTENKGLAIEDMLKTHVIPFLKKKLKHKEEIAAILDDAGVSEIDALYVPHAAAKQYNAQVKAAVLKGDISQLQPFNPQEAQQNVKQSLSQYGNKRFFKPDEMGQKQWDAIFSDFEWDSLKVEVTNENVDKQAVLSTLSSVLQTIATNPTILQDENAKMIFSRILSETGIVSPIQLSSTSSPSPSNQPAQPGAPFTAAQPANVLPARVRAPALIG